MEAIILAGGRGTRLGSLTDDVPKPMLPIRGKPFLSFLFDYLNAQGIQRLIVSVGYLSSVVQNYFGGIFEGMDLTYAKEEYPLGTGGAIRNALNITETEDIFVLNGDTIYQVSLSEMARFHRENQAMLTMAVKLVTNTHRYGAVMLDGDIVTGFVEKQKFQSEGSNVCYINGGIYLLSRSLFDNNEWPESFSFEKDYLEVCFRTTRFYGFRSNAPFLDIGVPEDYQRAQSELH